MNTWEDDGHVFSARHRLLRWLPSTRLRSKLSASDRRALELLCDRLPELVPERPASLTHGDLWAQDVRSTPGGLPAVIDPAVSYTWAEVDLSHLWCSPHPPVAERFFAVYAEVTALDADWGQARKPGGATSSGRTTPSCSSACPRTSITNGWQGDLAARACGSCSLASGGSRLRLDGAPSERRPVLHGRGSS